MAGEDLEVRGLRVHLSRVELRDVLTPVLQLGVQHRSFQDVVVVVIEMLFGHRQWAFVPASVNALELLCVAGVLHTAAVIVVMMMGAHLLLLCRSGQVVAPEVGRGCHFLEHARLPHSVEVVGCREHFRLDTQAIHILFYLQCLFLLARLQLRKRFNTLRENVPEYGTILQYHPRLLGVRLKFLKKLVEGVDLPKVKDI